MPYRYRCGVCHTSSPLGSRWDARLDRAEHRARVHHGLVPDGEVIEYGRLPTDGWRGPLKWVAALAAYALADWLWRHL